MPVLRLAGKVLLVVVVLALILVGSGLAIPQDSNTAQAAGSWSSCAAENGPCSFSGAKTVAYGTNGRVYYKSLSNGTACSNSAFGDPDYGTVKGCYIAPLHPAGGAARAATAPAALAASGSQINLYRWPGCRPVMQPLDGAGYAFCPPPPHVCPLFWR